MHDISSTISSCMIYIYIYIYIIISSMKLTMCVTEDMFQPEMS